MRTERFWLAMGDKNILRAAIHSGDTCLVVEDMKNLTPLDDGRTAVFVEHDEQMDDHRIYYLDVEKIERLDVHLKCTNKVGEK
jgi:hypothetical protein